MKLEEAWMFTGVLAKDDKKYFIEVMYYAPREHYSYQIFESVSYGRVYITSNQNFPTLEEACIEARTKCLELLTENKIKPDSKFDPLKCFD